MKNFKKLFNLMNEKKKLYMISIIAIVVTQILATMIPLLLQTTIDGVIGSRPIDNLLFAKVIDALGGRVYLRERIWIVGISIVVLTLFRGIFIFIRNITSVKAVESGMKTLRDDLYDHIQRLPYRTHVTIDTGELIQKCTSDVETIKKFLTTQLLEVFNAIFIILFVVITMVKLNFKMTLASLVSIPILFYFSYKFFDSVKVLFKSVDETEAKLSTKLQENLTGVRVVKAFSKQDYEIEEFDIINSKFKDELYLLNIKLAEYWGMSDLLTMTQTGFIVIYGSYLAFKGEISIGVFTAFITYIGMLLFPIKQMGRNLTEMGKAFVSLERIEEIFEMEIEELYENGKKPKIQGGIEFNDVYFKYEENNPVLEGLTFTIEPGTTVAIIGPTGAGKSSLVHLIPRLYDYDLGSIKIDGIELKDIDRSWIRENVGLVLQEPFLYARDIRENIRFIEPRLKESSVYEAAEIASIHEDIISFDKGYDTFVGERGSSLSGGQKQRIAIARTIIKDYPIVIFDDSLSAVDTETDISIRKALEGRKNKSTTIIISHRISTASEADKILVLDGGRVVESGRHEELILNDKMYKKIYDIQNDLNFS